MRTQPHLIRALIAHEPPVLRILPDADKWLAFIAQVYVTALTSGMQKAMQDFIASIVMPPTPPGPELAGTDVFQQINERQQTSGSSEFGMRCELLPSSNYKPDTVAIKRNGVKVVIAIGKATLDGKAYYGRTVPILAEQLGCEMVTLPSSRPLHGESARMVCRPACCLAQALTPTETLPSTTSPRCAFCPADLT